MTIFDDISDSWSEFEYYHPILSMLIAWIIAAVAISTVLTVASFLLGESKEHRFGESSRLDGNPKSNIYYEQIPFEIKTSSYSNDVDTEMYAYLSINVDTSKAAQQSLTSVDKLVEDICKSISSNITSDGTNNGIPVKQAMVYIGDTGNGMLIHKDATIIYGTVKDSGIGIDETSDNYRVFQYKETGSTWAGVSVYASTVQNMLAGNDNGTNQMVTEDSN